MEQQPLSETEPTDLVLVEQEIEGVIVRFPNGLVTGYRWRIHTESTAPGHTQGTPSELPWVFASRESVLQMLAQWQHELSKAESQNERPPGTQVQ